MKQFLCTLAVAALLFTPIAGVAQNLPAKFDPSRDAAKDVATAVAAAKAQGKRVLVDVGGEWCPWCHILDRFVAANPDVQVLRDAGYVWVKVNWSKENKNEALLSRWPAIKGYPHLFVLDADGKLIHSQDTEVLEAGKDYDKAKVVAFLKQWAPQKGTFASAPHPSPLPASDLRLQAKARPAREGARAAGEG